MTSNLFPFARGFLIFHGVAPIALNEVVGISTLVFVEAVVVAFQAMHAGVGEWKVDESVEGIPE